MARRKRRGLGESETYHTKRGHDALAQAERYAVDAGDLALRGKSATACDSANNLLVQAHSAYAAGVAHSGSGARGLTPGVVGSTLAHAHRVFKANCKVVKR